MTGRRRGPVRPRNDPGQYDDLAAEWWSPRGQFAMLHWIATARGRHIPPSVRGGALLLDVACGGGLLAGPVQAIGGYRHVGLDLSPTAIAQAAAHGVAAVRGDARVLPFADKVFDVVVAGEVLEHVREFEVVIAEACRVLRPGGTLVLDSIARTWWGRFSAVTVGERLPAGPPRRLHDPALFIDRARLHRVAQDHGVALRLNGLRPSAVDYLGWLAGRKEVVRMLPTGVTAGLFQAVGRKAT